MIFEKRSRQLIENKGRESERTRKRTRRGGWKAVNLLKIDEINEPVTNPKRGFLASIFLKTLGRKCGLGMAKDRYYPRDTGSRGCRATCSNQRS
jgi:hypothetical protein